MVFRAMAITHTEMERRLRSHKASEKKSLPGERRGVSGVGAGHDSGRSANGLVRSQQASVSQEAIADNKGSQSSSRASPSLSATQVFQPALTQAGLPRQRKKWTSDVNETIVRIYYRVTNLDTDVTGYRQRLFSEFTLIFPNFTVNEQRLADQYRAILRCNLIPKTRLETIKDEIRKELQTNQNSMSLMRDENERTSRAEERSTSFPESANTMQYNEDEGVTEALKREMERAIIQFQGTNPLLRPTLRKLNSSKKLARLIETMNCEILPEYVHTAQDLETLHMVIYSAAITIVRTLGISDDNTPGSRRRVPQMPKWELRMVRKIEKLRSDIARLNIYIEGSRSPKLLKKMTGILRQCMSHSNRDENTTVQQCLDTLKQKLSVVTARLSRYRKSRNRRKDNFLFTTREKNFYQTMENKESTDSETVYPSRQEIETFWGNQLATSTDFNSEASWIKAEQNRSSKIQLMQLHEISTHDITSVIKSTFNWRAPGPDGIQNFWYKRFHCVHMRLAELINSVIKEPSKMPRFLTQGITYLTPKDAHNIQDPSKYRPITCLPTLYKIITSCLSQMINIHCEQNNILAEEQKGCRKGSKGCKEQLIIDSVVCNLASKKNRNLYMAYVDFRKAFDSVPHDWLLAVLRLYKVNSSVITFLQHVITTWRTKIHLRTPTQTTETDIIPIKRGIFQGDSLSPLWFILCMNPLSNMLNATEYGFTIKSGMEVLHRINHLAYMDDVKLYASTKTQLTYLLKTVERFSNDIRMQFGLDKCRAVSLVKGKLQNTAYDLETCGRICGIEAEETYRYLGVEQARRIDHTRIKNELTTEFGRRVRRILKTGLNGGNTSKAINTYAVPILGYSAGIVSWSITDIENIQQRLRVLLSKTLKHHPRASVERVTLPRRLGGRGFTDINTMICKQVESLRKFFHAKSTASKLHAAVCAVDEWTPLKLCQSDVSLTALSIQQKLDAWMAKPIHGRHPNEISQAHVDTQSSNYWLISGQIFPETEGFMVAIQDQVIPTRNYRKYILKDPSVNDDRCRFGCGQIESIQHITSGCSHIAGSEYRNRHDAVAKVIHQELAQKYQLSSEARVPHYVYNPENVLENHSYRLYWDRTILTDRTVICNRPDIVLFNKENRQVDIIDVSIPNTSNLQLKYTEKKTKYVDLSESILQQWNAGKVRIIPFIISSTGAIPKTMHQSLKELDLPENLWKLMQKVTIISTARIVRKFVGNQRT